jgi:hypothetical protein
MTGIGRAAGAGVRARRASSSEASRKPRQAAGRPGGFFNLNNCLERMPGRRFSMVLDFFRRKTGGLAMTKILQFYDMVPGEG